MITLPKEFQPVPMYPGYFWHTEKKKLFSIKVAGTLRELKLRRVHWAAKRHGGFPYMHVGDKYYEVSYKGRRKIIPYEQLLELNKHKVDYEIPITRVYE